MRRLDTTLSSCMLVTSPGRTVISTSPSKAHKEGIDIWHLFPELVTYLQLCSRHSGMPSKRGQPLCDGCTALRISV